MKDSRRKFAISIAGIVLPIIAGVLIIGINTIGCDSIQQTEYKGSIKGWVYEDSTKTPVSRVLISSTEFTQVVYTNDSGMFLLGNLNMGTSEQTFQLILEKTDYAKLIFNAKCKSDEIFIYDSIFMQRNNL